MDFSSFIDWVVTYYCYLYNTAELVSWSVLILGSALTVPSPVGARLFFYFDFFFSKHLSVQAWEHRRVFYFLHFVWFDSFVCVSAVQIWKGTITHQTRWRSRRKSRQTRGAESESHVNPWDWCCDCPFKKKCKYTYGLIFSRRQEAEQPNQLEEGCVTMRVSACRLSPVCVGPTTIHPYKPLGCFFCFVLF